MSFSDHLSLKSSYSLTCEVNRFLAPWTKPQYKIPPNIAKEEIFKQRLKYKLIDWNIVKDSGVDILIWWEYMVKKRDKGASKGKRY